LFVQQISACCASEIWNSQKKPPVSLGKSGFVPEKTKPQALGACGLYLLFIFLKDTERQTP
jgi:hypothetical protein